MTTCRSCGCISPPVVGPREAAAKRCPCLETAETRWETAETMRPSAAARTVKTTAPMPDQPPAGDALLRMPSERSTRARALANEPVRPRSRPLDAELATRRSATPRFTQSIGAIEPERPGASPVEHAKPTRVAGPRGESCAPLCFGRVAQVRTGGAAKCREGLRAGHRRPPSSKPTTRTGSLMLRLFFSLPVVVAQTSFSSKSSLQGALAEWCGNPASAEAAHGHISAWDTGAVTDMSSLVYDAPCRSSFNGAIGSWDVAQVTNMGGMFLVRPEPLPHRASAREPPALPAARRLCTPRAPEHSSPQPLSTPGSSPPASTSLWTGTSRKSRA